MTLIETQREPEVCPEGEVLFLQAKQKSMYQCSRHSQDSIPHTYQGNAQSHRHHTPEEEPVIKTPVTRG